MEVIGLGIPALVVVDVQRDFCPGGALGVKGGDEVVEPLNRVISAFREAGLPIFFTRDWHPPNHCSFVKQGGVWPPHCVVGTGGAEFHRDLTIPAGSAVVSKATTPDSEAYSGFQGTELEAELRRPGATELVLGGLATDYCVLQTCLDGLARGFEVKVMTDCIRGVNLRPGDSALALSSMTASGATLTTSGEVVKQCRRAAMMSSSRP